MQNKELTCTRKLVSGMVAILLMLSTVSFAQNDKFLKGMKANIALLDSAKTAADFTSVAANFERIGDAEKNQWLPYYYAGLALTRVGWLDQKMDKDKNGEQIKTLCNKAEAIEKNAEIYSIRNMAATQQMLVNPQERWQTYGQEAAAALQQGMQVDPNNPRLYYLQGVTLLNTPEQFGGGKVKAKPVLEKALALFKAFKPVNNLYPTWGQEITEQTLEQCK